MSPENGNQPFLPGPTANTVRSADGKVLTAPKGWILLPPGDAALTRRVKAAGDHWAGARSRGDLDSDRMFQLAMVRLVEIIGEAASRLTKETYTRHAGIPWPQIISTRNRLIHGYDQIDHDILWNILTQDLPPLIPTLEGILAKP